MDVPANLEGLTSAEAARVRARVGPNRWVAHDRFARVREVLEMLADPMAVMLAIAAAIYLALGETRDATILLIALVPILGVDVLLEARSRSALAKLAARATPSAQVVRDGKHMSVAVDDIVPGDLLAVREGQVVGADGVLVFGANVSSDESALTGEAQPAQKRVWADDVNAASADARVFAGAPIVTGHGFARVIATGTATQYGRIASLVASTREASPLQRRTGALVRKLGTGAFAVAAVLFIAGVARGQSIPNALLGAVSLSMAAIPEEFPVVLTLFLSVGAWRLASRGMLVRRLASVETLGSTTVICTDKTGTLTLGHFQVTAHVIVDAATSESAFLEAALLACETHPVDLMEQAIVSYASARGATSAAALAAWTLVRDHDFDPDGKHMAHAWRRRGREHESVVVAKGAIEGVLEHCNADAATRSRALDANTAMASRGLRILAVAAKRTASARDDRAEDVSDLALLGLLGFEDPLRPEVPNAVHECQRAGIRVKMITGDHLLTAHAIADAAGIAHAHDELVTGDDLVAASDTERGALIDRATIFARINPEQKFQIVDALKARGHIVAMTGDGVNDAPALRRADIGIAMGLRGTDVARATADLVLLDDNFASIVATIGAGRHIFHNIQRAFLYLIAFHVPIIALAVLAPIAGVPLVLHPVHLVWLELIVHPVSALVFQADPASSASMREPPRPTTAPLLPRRALLRSAWSGVLLAIAAFAIYRWQVSVASDGEARACALITLMSGYQMLMFVERAALPGLVTLVPRARTFWVVWVVSALSLIGMLTIPALTHTFRVELPSASRISVSVIAGVMAIAWRILRPPPRQ